MPQFTPFVAKMQNEGLPDIIVKIFHFYYKQLVNGETGLIAEETIQPIDQLPDVETFSAEFAEIGHTKLAQTILLKLNGGLGTSMGLAKAKSLLTVKDDLTFLDIIARQAQQATTPLVLMNSFATQTDSLNHLRPYTDITSDIPLDFLQHKVPKIAQANLTPVDWSKNPALEWCPPGHGDIYAALVTSGMLDTLLDNGYHYAFVSNADNLGAILDVSILGYLVKHNLPFMMEVADRTEADKKGGHLAQLPNKQLILRESAQCPPEDVSVFQDITHHKYFNTNNLWLNLSALKEVLNQKDNILGLPMIRNLKTVDSQDPNSPSVYQLETAMGSAITVFPNAQAVRVPRTRFAPVKTTNDFLAVGSDAYIITDDFRVILNPQRTLPPPVINLDPDYYKLIKDMETRFPHGSPSLIACEQFTVKGDIKFGRDIIIQGNVKLINQSAEQIIIPDNAIFNNQIKQW